MTDVLAPVFIPYTRFLEVRARRLDIVTELTQPNEQRTNNVAVSSGPIANNECHQPSTHDSQEEKEKPRQQSIVGD